ncbi:MAG: WbqC family protein [Patescibacteria group bacterium]
MILVAHQPEYLPYLGFFYKASKADKFIFVDHVQFQKEGFQNRNRIRTAPGQDGWTWLTIPVATKNKTSQKINEVKIDNSRYWAKKHWKSIYFAYKGAPFFNKYKDFFEKTYLKKWEYLADLNETIIIYLFKELNIQSPIYKSSDYDIKGQKTDMIINLCKAMKADTHLSGPGLTAEGGEHYVEEEKFKKQGLNHIFSDFKHPIYNQQFEPFIYNMSAIDLLFNYGEESREILKSANLKK